MPLKSFDGFNGFAKLKGTSSSGTYDNPIDTFDDQTLTEYSGDTASFTFDNATKATADAGHYSITATDSGTQPFIASSAGLVNYPSPGDTFRFATRFDTASGGPRIWFGVQDATSATSERYQIFLNAGTSTAFIEKYQNGTFTQIGPTGGAAISNFTTNTWYDVQVRWETSGRIAVNVFKFGGANSLCSIEGTDTTITSGGIGFIANTGGGGGTLWYDDARITATESITDSSLIVDDFNDGSLSEYDYHDTAVFSAAAGANIASNAGVASDYGVLADSVAAGTGGNIIANAGSLKNDILAGDTIHVFWENRQTTPDANSTFRIMWAQQDATTPFDEFYGLAVRPASGEVTINYDDGTTQTALATTTWTPTANTTYEFVIDWNTDATGNPTGVFTVDCFDATGTRVDDGTAPFPFDNSASPETTFSSGGFGIYANLTAQAAIDHVTIDRGESTTVIENFETDLTAYSGDTTGFTLGTTAPIEGSKSLLSTASGASIINQTITTTRGYEYLFRMNFGTTESYPRIIFNDQGDGLTVGNNCYMVFAGTKAGDMVIQERSGGNWVQRTSRGHSFAADTTYTLGFASTENRVWLTLYDANDNIVAQTYSLNTSTYSGGNLGFESSPTLSTGGVADDRWDLIARRPIQGSAPAVDPTTTDTLDSFERTSPLDDYSIDGGRVMANYFSSTTTAADVDEGMTAIGRTSSPLAGEWTYILRDNPPQQIERGNNYRWSVKAGSGQTTTFPSVLFLSSFNVNGNVNGYKIQVSAETGTGYISIRELTDSAETELAQSLLSSDLPTGEYVDIQLQLANPGTDTIEAAVFDSTGTELGRVSVTDATYNGPSYGVGAFRSNTFFDYIRLHTGSTGGGGGSGADITGVYQPTGTTDAAVQAAIDQAYTDGGGVVFLEDQVNYTPSTTWVLKPNVGLDFNGASVRLSGSQDFLLFANNSYCRNAWVTSGSSYNGRVFLFDTAHAAWPSGEPRQYDTREHMYVESAHYSCDGATSGDTLFYFHQNGSSQFVSDVGVDCDARYASTIAAFYSENSAGFINNCEVHGVYSHPVLLCDMWGPGKIRANQVFPFYQPGGGISEGCWRIRGTASQADGNFMNGQLWDFGPRTGGPMIIANNGSWNYIFASPSFLGHGSNYDVVSESGNASNNYVVDRPQGKLFSNGVKGTADGGNPTNIGTDGLSGDIISTNFWDLYDGARATATNAGVTDYGSTFINPQFTDTTVAGTIAAPGNVQTALNTNAGGLVRLQPGTTYTPSSRWHIPPETYLDFNGATVAPSTDHDIIIFDRQTVVKRANIDTTGITFNSSAFVIDTGHPDIESSPDPFPNYEFTRVEGGTYRGSNGNGTVLDYIADPRYMGGHRSWIDADGGQTFCRIYCFYDGVNNNWANSIGGLGNVSGFNVYILMEGGGGNRGHQFDLDLSSGGNVFWRTNRPATEGGAMNRCIARANVTDYPFTNIVDWEEAGGFSILDETSTQSSIATVGGNNDHAIGVSGKRMFTTESVQFPESFWEGYGT